MDALKQHQSMKHLQKRPFKCPVCPMSFFKQSHLNRHRTHYKHQVAKDKVADFKSDALNSVVADALCELAAGRRSAVIDVKGSSVKSSSSTSTSSAAVLRNSGPAAVVNQDSRFSSVAGAKTLANATMLALAKYNQNSAALAASSSLMTDDSGISADGRNSDENFVQRVMVDGGSVGGARVVMLESCQTMEVVVETLGQDGTSGTSCPVVDTAATQHQHPPAQPLLIVEQPAVSDDEPGYMIIGEPDQSVTEAISQLVGHGGGAVQHQQHPDVSSSVSTADVTASGVAVGAGSVGDSAASHRDMIVVEGSSTSVGTDAQAEAPSLLTKVEPSGPTSAAVEETHGADSALESTMQSLLSGSARLETVEPIARVRRGGGGGRVANLAGGVVVVKEEVEERWEEGPAGSHQPLTTRSGRQRKIKVKFSA